MEKNLQNLSDSEVKKNNFKIHQIMLLLTNLSTGIVSKPN
jgi:hypothetical protein